MTITLRKLGFVFMTTACLHSQSYSKHKFGSTSIEETSQQTRRQKTVNAEERFAWILDYLEEVKDQFDHLNNVHSKRNLVTCRLNEDAFCHAQSLSTLNRDALYAPYKPSEKELQNTTHALALAIWAGNVKLVESFLSVIEDVNAEDLRIWGYRQWYTLGHLAADPQFPVRPLNSTKNEAWLEIMDLLAAKGADFQLVYEGWYTNPALAAGEPSGRELPEGDERRARLLLHGADPTYVGSSYAPLYREKDSRKANWRMDKIAALAVEQLKVLHTQGKSVTPTDVTKEVINNEIENQIARLTSLKL